MGFDKFTWMRAVYADRQLSVSAKAVGAYCATFYVRYGEETFAVRQETIAERCGTTRKTVNAAFRDLREAGYLTKGQVRQVGRGYRGGDECRLLFPATCNESLHDLLGNESLHDMGETCNANDPERVTHRGKTCNPTNASTSENDTPKGSYKGCMEGSGDDRGSVGARTAPERIPIEPPQRSCKEHHHWLGPACGRCRNDKNAYQTWLADSRRLLGELDRLRANPNTQPAQVAAISNERRTRIAVFQRIGEQWK